MEIGIGELARLAGLPVKTVRYYSDIGLVSELSRSEAGYRRYDEGALARLELVRTLRELGVDLATIGRVLARSADLSDVADAHAGAIDLQIRRLRLRRSVLRAIARSGAGPQEVARMTRFAGASADDARRVMEEFLDAVFADHPDDPFAAQMRAAVPELPDQPTDAQIDAWVELSGLVGDAAFRERIRQMVSEGARLRRERGMTETDEATRKAGMALVAKAGEAVHARVAPDTPEAAAIVDELVGGFAAAAGRRDDPDYRRELLGQMEMFSDERVERYWFLLGAIAGREPAPPIAPLYNWFIAALRARL